MSSLGGFYCETAAVFGPVPTHYIIEMIISLSVCGPTDKAQLCLFGSSKNGFGFRDSDLDICMTLEGHETAEVNVHNM